MEPPPEPLPGPVTIDFPSNELEPGISLDDGVLTAEHGDGSATFDFNPDLSDPHKTSKSGDFYANLANKLDDSRLAEIATQILEGIDRDEMSRKDWMETRARGITLLGLKIEDPKSDVTAGAPLEGMSTVRHPLLLESTVAFQATAGGELLPASGPVKIRNDATSPPKKPKLPQLPPPPPMQPGQGIPPIPMGPPMGPQDTGPMPPPPMAGPPPMMPPGGAPPMPPPMIGHNGGPPLDAPPDPLEGQSLEELATALETDMNHFLTSVATEYYPDTDRMLFYVGFGGDGFKKVYNCPLRRRPVSESVDAENLIVSNASTDMQNCARITHKIKMRKSVIRRMQILKEYRDITLSTPSPAPPNPVEQKKEDIQGQHSNQQRPEDQDYTIYECYCELDLDEFAPRKFKGKGLPLPYRVTIERDSKQVLSLIRNWNEDDAECLPKQFFVQFPFIRGLGFYGLGFIHLVGNTTNALTAAWREMLDAGMFANFPGFLYNKSLNRQLTNQFRVPPGGGVGVDVGTTGDIRQAIMALPYKEPGPAFMAFIKEIQEQGKSLAATSQITVGEGKQDAPVGTTLALIEQATKLINSVHKRLHAAQAEEFQLLKERFREDPEAFWRHNKRPTLEWKKEQFLAALDSNDLVPVADPNNPTSLHRIAKATAIKTLQQASPRLYDGKAVDERIFRIVGIDPEGLFLDQPAPEPPDPRIVAIQEKAKANEQNIMGQRADAMLKAQIAMAQLKDKALDRESKERIENIKVEIEKIRLLDAQVTHQRDFNAEEQQRANDYLLEQVKQLNEIRMKHLDQGLEHSRALFDQHHEQRRAENEHVHEQRVAESESQREAERAQRKHEQEMRHAEERHAADLEHARKLNEAKVEAARKLAAAKPKPKAKKKES